MYSDIIPGFEDPSPASFQTKFPQRFEIACLTKDDIPAFLTLQDKAWFALARDKKHHLKLKSPETLEAHIDAGMAAIGIKDTFNNHALVAQALLTCPAHYEGKHNLAGYPVASDDELTGVIQSLCSDPDSRGYHHARHILEQAKSLAFMKGMTSIIAKIADDNIASQYNFEKAGFEFENAVKGIDPKQGYPVTYVRHDLYKGCGATMQNMALTSQIA